MTNTTKESKEYVIYTRRIAYELRKKGFKILRTEPNPNKPEFDCYVFECSDKLQNVMKELSSYKS